ncbi:MAG: adenosylcobinamide amidohydrolase [Thermoplasmata archaeon]
MKKGKFRLVERPEFYIIHFHKPARMFSSAPFKGGAGTCSTFINRHVDIDYNHDVESECSRFLHEYGIEENHTTITLTAADVSKRKIFLNEDGTIFIIATAGLNNALSVGSTGYQSAGTVNIAIVADIPLSDSAAINLIQSSVEAKCQAMNDAGVRDMITGDPAPGTSTDSISLFITDSGNSERFAGRITPHGRIVSMEIYRMVMSFAEEEIRNGKHH